MTIVLTNLINCDTIKKNTERREKSFRFFNLDMKDIVYLLARKLTTPDGGVHYDPCITQPENSDEIKIIASDDLIGMQNEFADDIEMLRQVVDTIIVPVNTDVYEALNEELNEILDEFKSSMSVAIEKMAEAYKIMGIEFDMAEISDKINSGINKISDVGRVIAEDLTLTDRLPQYVADDYVDELDEFDEDYDGYDDDYDSDEEDEEDYDNN